MAEQTTEIDFNKETIKVIGYREGGLWYALGLEVSILGRGKTFEEAVSLLEELIQDQIEFCNENAMSYHYRSEERYFQLYEELKNRESKTKMQNPIGPLLIHSLLKVNGRKSVSYPLLVSAFLQDKVHVQFQSLFLS